MQVNKKYSFTKCKVTLNYILIFIALFFGDSILLSQEPFLLSTLVNQHNFTETTETYLDFSRVVTLDSIQGKSFTPNRDLPEFKRKEKLDHTYWRKFSITNDTDVEQRFHLSTGNFALNTLYLYEANTLISTSKFGIKVPRPNRPLDYDVAATIIDIASDKTYKFYLQQQYPYIFEDLEQIFILEPEYHKKNQEEYLFRIKGILYFRIVTIAILAFLFLFTLVQFIQHRHKSFLYYSGYVFIMALYFLDRYESSPFFNLFFSYATQFKNSFPNGEPSHFSSLSFIFYSLFTIYFLDIHKYHPRLKKMLYVIVAFVMIVYAIHLGMLLFGAQPSTILDWYYGYRDVLNIFLIIALIMIAIRIRNRLAIYYLTGTTILVIFTIIPQYSEYLSFPSDVLFFKDTSVWTQMGTLIECFLFSAGLGYKTKLAFQERDQAQSLLLKKSNEKEILQKKYNDELKVEVEHATAALITGKEKLIKAEYENKLLELESQMLSSQMNPHFLFNSLNSIKYYAISKSPEETAKYISDFAKLMRQILQHSRSKFILLKEEISLLTMYIKIEQKRFDYSFQYTIDIDPEINTRATLIPTMMIQPLVENAILHGLRHKIGDQQLSLKIRKEKDQILVQIHDNGIGRVESNKYKNYNIIGKKRSLATSITEERIQLLKTLQNLNIIFEINDMINTDSESTGTIAQIWFPIIQEMDLIPNDN